MWIVKINKRWKGNTSAVTGTKDTVDLNLHDCVYLHPKDVCEKEVCEDKKCPNCHIKQCKNWIKFSCKFGNACENKHVDMKNIGNEMIIVEWHWECQCYWWSYDGPMIDSTHIDLLEFTECLDKFANGKINCWNNWLQFFRKKVIVKKMNWFISEKN